MQEKVAWGDTWARSTWHLNTDGLHIHCSFVHLKQDRFYFAGFPLFVFLNSKQYRMTSVKDPDEDIQTSYSWIMIKLSRVEFGLVEVVLMKSG